MKFHHADLSCYMIGGHSSAFTDERWLQFFWKSTGLLLKRKASKHLTLAPPDQLSYLLYI